MPSKFDNEHEYIPDTHCYYLFKKDTISKMQDVNNLDSTDNNITITVGISTHITIIST
jgi:hypothetical protein